MITRRTAGSVIVGSWVCCIGWAVARQVTRPPEAFLEARRTRLAPSAAFYQISLGGDVTYDNGWIARDLRALRRDRIGFIFQAPYLIPFLNAVDNVALLPMLAGVSNAHARERALDMLAALDVAHRSAAHVLVTEVRHVASRPPCSDDRCIRFDCLS